jgi:FKBP-type peptidyl-prolyl cis-trans isomerase FkpA
MRIAIAVAVAAFLAPAVAGAQDLKTDDQKILYAVGVILAERQLGPFALSKPELEIVKRGITDGVLGNKPAVDLPTYGPKIADFVKGRAPLKAKADEAKAKIDKDKGVAFADKAAKEPGAQKLPSGLVYRDLTPGNGASPKATDTVKVNYRGTLLDGSEFDSSYKRNQPAEFPLNGVIPCWTEGVQKMKVGGKARLVCPSNIAYGDAGHPPAIPGGATLVFEIELLEIKAAAQPAPGK